MTKRIILPVLAVTLCLAAAVICGYLLQKHITGSTGAAWFEAGCSDDATPGAANCATVLESPYAYFPPKSTEVDADGSPVRDRTPRLPAAFLGMLYYSSLAVWFVGVGAPNRRGRWAHCIPSIILAGGLLFSLWFSWIMFTKLNAWCPWCAVTHGLNLLIVICALLMFPWKGKQEPKHSPRSKLRKPATEAPVEIAWPPKRAVAVTLLAMIAVVAGVFLWMRSRSLQTQRTAYHAQLEQCKDAVERIQGDAGRLVRNWSLNEQVEFVLRPDEPIRTHAKAGEHSWDLVIFSDFECPACKRVAAFLEEKVQPLFAGRLRIIFRHFPLNQKCNAMTRSMMHPHACYAAAIAEAARSLGGNDAFWEAHDYLFANQHQLKHGQLDLQNTAIELGFDPPLFERVMNTEPVAKRVWHDVNDASGAKLTGTPAVYVKGRRVDKLAVTEIGFWDEMADRFWREAGTPRPAKTRLNNHQSEEVAATADNPDPSAAP